MDPTPLPIVQPVKETVTKKSSKESSKKSKIYIRPQSYRQSIGGKTITMKPSTERLLAGEKISSVEGSSSSHGLPSSDRSGTSIVSERLSNLESSLVLEKLEPPNSKILDNQDLQDMQIELGKSYELFQRISNKFESIDFGNLHKRIENLHLSESKNDLNKAATGQLKEMFETSFLKNRLGKLTTEVSDGFRRHPGEFADIPELSNFFQACAQLEHGLEALKKQRKRSRELEERVNWATEIAYNRMEEIRNSLGHDPKKNF